MLAERGVIVVVFEQNPRPYGKIEDGLPRWHVKLRRKEYETINDKLGRPDIHFVPCTKIGRDVDFRALTSDWGFSAIVMAHGAWHDRSLPVPGADAFVGKGLVYQNNLVYWFNHYMEREYAGPQCVVEDGALVVGGGLASLDVIKILQIETTRAALADLGIDEDILKIEQEGIPAVLDEHGFGWDELGLRGASSASMSPLRSKKSTLRSFWPHCAWAAGPKANAPTCSGWSTSATVLPLSGTWASRRNTRPISNTRTRLARRARL